MMKLKSIAEMSLLITFTALVGLALGAAAGCGSSTGSKDVANPALNTAVEPLESKPAESKNETRTGDAVLEENRRLWAEKHIANYDLVIQLEGEGEGVPVMPVLIRVRDRKVESIGRLNRNDKRDAYLYDIFEQWAPVEKIYGKIIEESANGRQTSVKYNRELGYPEDVGIMDGSTYWMNCKIKSFKIVTQEN